MRVVSICKPNMTLLDIMLETFSETHTPWSSVQVIQTFSKGNFLVLKTFNSLFQVTDLRQGETMKIFAI